MNATGKVLFDTNILLYMYSRADSGKQRKALELFRSHAQSGRLLVSTQVVQEFYVAGARKLGMPRPELLTLVSAFLELPLVIITAGLIRTAIDTEARYSISFWDALIVAAAESAGAETLFTEDLNHGQRYGNVTVRNPFQAAD